MVEQVIMPKVELEELEVTFETDFIKRELLDTSGQLDTKDFAQQGFNIYKPIKTETVLSKELAEIHKSFKLTEDQSAGFLQTHIKEEPEACLPTDGRQTITPTLQTCMKEHNASSIIQHSASSICEDNRTDKSAGDTFYSNQTISPQMTDIPTDEKSFTCKFCQAKFKKNNDLVRHIRSHTGEKPYCCDICQTYFRQRQGLTNHLRTHTGDKPYFCSYCQFKCADSSSLKRHIRIHTGERPYSCLICGAKFIESYKLNIHMRKHR